MILHRYNVKNRMDSDCFASVTYFVFVGIDHIVYLVSFFKMLNK